MIGFLRPHLYSLILHFEMASNLSMLSISLEIFWMSENEILPHLMQLSLVEKSIYFFGFQTNFSAYLSFCTLSPYLPSFQGLLILSNYMHFHVSAAPPPLSYLHPVSGIPKETKCQYRLKYYRQDAAKLFVSYTSHFLRNLPGTQNL